MQRRKAIKFAEEELKIIQDVIDKSENRNQQVLLNSESMRKNPVSFQFNIQNQIKVENRNNSYQKPEEQFETTQFMLKWGAKVSQSPLYILFYRIILIIFIISCIMQGADKKQWILAGEIMQKIIQILFAIFFVIMLLNYQRLSTGYLVFEFVLLIVGISSNWVEDDEASRYLKAMRSFKFLVLFKTFDILQKPMKEFIHAWKRVCTILIPVLFITYITAVISLFCFADLEYKNVGILIINFQNNIGQYMSKKFFFVEKDNCLNPIDYDVEPNPKELQNITQGNGLLQFSNIFYALFSTFKQIFVTGSSRVIVLYRHAVNPYFVSFLFFSFIYFIPYIYFNIFYGVLITDKKSAQEQEADINNGEKIQKKDSEEKSSNQRNEQSSISMASSESFKKNTIHQDHERNDRNDEGCREKKTPQNIFEVAGSSELNNRIEEAKFDESREGLSRHSCEQKEKEEKKEMQQIKKVEKLSGLQICNIILVILCTVNLSLEFEGQSQPFEFAVDCTSVVLYLLYCIVMCFQIANMVNTQHISKCHALDIVIFIGCTIGYIYEGSVATSFEEFLSAESLVADIGRCLMYLRIFVIVSSPGVRNLFLRKTLNIFFQALYAIRWFLLCWCIMVIMLSIIGYHLHHSNSHASPYRISFTDFYHSFVYTILVIYDEEWDIFMFQQYVDSGALAVIWVSVILILGLIMFTKYMMCLEAKQLSEILSTDHPHQQTTATELPSQYESRKQINEVAANQQSQKQQAGEPPHCSTILKQRLLCAIQNLLQSRVYMVLKAAFLLTACCSEALADPPTPITSDTYHQLSKVDAAVTIYFFIDAMLNCLVFGVVCGEDAYMRKSHWNKLNVGILVVELLTFTPLRASYVFHRMKRVRIMRVLIVLKIRYDNDWSMRIMIRSLFRLIPKMFKLIGVSLIIYYYFALMLCKFYKDDLYYCEHASPHVQVIKKEDCLNWGGDWVKHHFNFTTPLQALLYLFLVATMEGWSTLMGHAMDIAGKGYAPSYNANEHIQILFILFFFFGNMIVLNSIISVSLYNYQKIKEQQTGEYRLTDEERTWLNIKVQIMRLVPVKKEVAPQNCIRRQFYKMCQHKGYFIFKSFIFGLMVIGTSLLTTGFQYFRLWLQFWGFTCVVMLFQYLSELIAFGFKFTPADIFETLIFLYSFIYYAIWRDLRLTDDAFIIFGGLFILCQVCRYIKLLDEIPFTSRMLHTMLTILPRSFSIFFLMLIVIYLYGVVGMELFPFLKPGQELNQWDQNYRNIASALFSLIKFSIMESPISQIQDASHTVAPNSVCHQVYTYSDFQEYGYTGCGSSILANIFFLSFHLIYSLFLMPTFLAFVVDAYDDIRREENAHVTKHLLKKILDVWKQKDPQATGLIDYRSFWIISKDFLKISQQNHKKQKTTKIHLREEKKIFLINFKLNIYQNEEGVLSLDFHQVIEGLTKMYIEKNLKCQISQNQINEIYQKYKNEPVQSVLKITKYKSSDIAGLITMKLGLRRWRNRATGTGIFLSFQKMLRFNSKLAIE